ncbi:Sec-independent protein translocase protein TatB [Sphingomonas sp. 28-62-11]|uniref:Sec-independent protein translocase protein TatB n=1 Tax=Sphingomonas sp. 28-62-11 TaxID=1970432 RepID=UPI000BCEE0C6|nr:MAG: twin arginine-targeting protein translocase TatB [Sphingomonas sp. 28-62-11]
MFDVAPSELLLLAIVALVVIGPKDLPKAMRFVGQWVAKARGVMGQFRAGFDTMVREAELKEMEERWAAENARIMREYPPAVQQALPDTVHTTPDLDGEGEPVMTAAPVLHTPTPPVLTDDEIAAAEGVPAIAPVPPAATPNGATA